MIILLVDDEFPSRQELKHVLGQLLQEAAFYEASDGDEALAIIEKLKIDVVFLDINMPKISGLAVASVMVESPDPPLVVFATAHNQHALKAFELAALDYVVKPFTMRRLSKTVEQIRMRLGEKNTLDRQKILIQQFLAEDPRAKKPAKIWAERENGGRILLDYTDIVYFQAKEKRVFVKTLGGDYWRARYTLKELESRLANYDFYRTHKAFLVNINEIAELVPWFSRGYQIRLKDKTSSPIPLSRRYAPQLKKRLNW